MNPPSNDLPDVAALLKELESSAVWQELKASSSSAASAIPVAGPSYTEAQPAGDDMGLPTALVSGSINALPGISGTSVADLLSQLSSSTRIDDPTPSTSSTSNYGYSQNILTGLRLQDEHADDRRNLSFVQSLPVLARLGENPDFVASIQKMKEDQNKLERRLWEDREAIYTKYQGKIKVAQTKAQMIGTPISQHEITMLTDAFNKELFRYDHERVLPAWDGLVSRQQSQLGQMAVPAMFVTTDVQDTKKQQQVIGVLETITGANAA